MNNEVRTLNDLTVDELKGVINDLQCGVRYNDIKAKYNIPKMAFTSSTISQCEKLIAEKAPTSSPKKFTGYFGVKNATPEQHQHLLSIGVQVDENGYYVW